MANLVIKDKKRMSVQEFCDYFFGKCEKVHYFLSLPLTNFNPATGMSDRVELAQANIEFNNGGTWIRRGSTLDRLLFIKKFKEKNKIIALQLTGYRPFSKAPNSRGIAAAVKRYYRGERFCVNCGKRLKNGRDKNHDHKCGSYDKPNFDETDPKNFQMLCQHCNTLKRECCKKCVATGCRFDARRFKGEVLAWQAGGKEKEEGKCEGCYWNDIAAWRENNDNPVFVTRKRILKDNQDKMVESSCNMSDADAILD